MQSNTEFSRNVSRISEDVALYSSTTLYRDFILGEPLGRGGFGEIVKATRRCDKKEFAIKIIKFESNMEDVGNYRREAKYLSELDHNNIVRYYSSWIETAQIPYSEYKKLLLDDTSSALSSEIEKLSENGYLRQELEVDEDTKQAEKEKEGSRDNVCSEIKEMKYLFIQMELCEKRTLRTEIDEDLYVDDAKVIKYFKQICEGLAHIHKSGIAHRDLKPENIFLTSSDSIKIGDFGLSKQITIPNEDSPVDPLTYGSLSDVCGTSIYIAPELCTNNVFTIKADIYSLGIIYFEMCSKPMTVMEKCETFRLSFDKLKCINFQKNNKEKRDLIRNMLHSNIEKRPTCEDILKILNSGKSAEEIKEIMGLSRKIPYPQLRVFDKALKSKNIREIDLTNYFIQKAIKIFELHGARNIPIPTFLPPFARHYDNLTTLLNSHGNSVSVSNTSRIGFCCFVGKNNIKNIRRYSVTKTFQEGPLLPVEIQECTFEAISEETGDFVNDAEVLYMTQEICSAVFPHNHQQEVRFYLNHRAIFSYILKFCDINDKNRTLFTNLMLKISQKEMESIELYKMLSKVELKPEKKEFILKVLTPYNVVTAEQIILPKFKNKNRSIVKLFKSLQKVVENSEKFGIKKDNIFLSPLLITDKHCCGMMFKAELEDRTVIATGDRFDSVLNKCLQNSQNPNPKSSSAIGVSFNIGSFTNLLNRYYSSNNMPEMNIIIFTAEKSKVIPLYKSFLSLEIKCQIVNTLDYSAIYTPCIVIQYYHPHECSIYSFQEVVDYRSRNILYQGEGDFTKIVDVVQQHYSLHFCRSSSMKL